MSVLPYSIPEWSNGAPFQKWFATEFKRKTKDFGSGDLVYIVGVYKFLYGKKRNMPAVHVGHIAAMADGEEIITQDWRVARDELAPLAMYGHLVQAPTLGGASGSPVFVRRSVDMREIYPESKAAVVSSAYGSVWLLGLWHGAWQDVSRMVALPDGTMDFGTGMGIVVPATKILEALDQPILEGLRNAAGASNKSHT